MNVEKNALTVLSFVWYREHTETLSIRKVEKRQHAILNTEHFLTAAGITYEKNNSEENYTKVGFAFIRLLNIIQTEQIYTFLNTWTPWGLDVTLGEMQLEGK